MIQLGEQRRAYARAVIASGGASAPDAGAAASLAKAKFAAEEDRGGWGGACDELPEGIPETCTIERRDANALSVKEFEEEFAMLGRPVILTGGAAGPGLFDEWGARTAWRREALRQQLGDSMVTVARSSDIVSLQAKGESTWAERLVTMSLGDYVGNHMGSNATSTAHDPMYLFRSKPFAAADLRRHYEHPRFFANLSFFHMAEEARDHKALFSAGPAGSGAPVHQHTAAWNAVVWGAKRWYLLPPAARHGPDTEMGSMLSWLRNTKPLLPVQPLECTQYAGELLFVPASWWHGVLNLCDTVGVAVECGVEVPARPLNSS